ncbi:MAG: thioredoxin domain-containing protein [Chlorobi bacterium OLB7]|nr:MAG: thioredoxin domain-containing protein [Chlorobi bacterium OLB7]
MPNRLLHERSPYLQQHAHNPVDWYPWGEEAFARARSEGKPIFLSIGYSTCHWCHVMERESFEDQETAAMMNERFINIKVDREERPDVDHIYMTALHSIAGSGGWPLSVWLTPELLPFYAGTYFPPRPAYGRPSFRDALRALSDAWQHQREKVLDSATAIIEAVEKISLIQADGGVAPLLPIAERCFQHLQRSYDPRHGGFSGRPKFPQPSILQFLLRYRHHVGNAPAVDQRAESALAMVHHTLRSMSGGGMYDQLGGGFARYSVDEEWRVPHFEKMLYDQGQLLSLLADTYRLTHDPELARVIGQTADYLERDMTAPNGAFYSAEDADSEGEEGKFYVWTMEELRAALPDRELAAVVRFYGIEEEGNFEHGKNVLHTSATLADVAEALGTDIPEVEQLLATARERLFQLRQQRVRPHRDEKILAAWNGLAIGGLANAAAALSQPRFAAMAERAARAVLETMMVDGKLMRRWKDGEAKFAGYLDDYAFVAAGLIELYHATLNPEWLRHAEQLTRLADHLFHDDVGGGYFMASGGDPAILVRPKVDHDGAEPAGNSVMAMNLLRLGRLLGDPHLLGRAERTIHLFLNRVADVPIMMPLMSAVGLALSAPPRQVVVAAGADPSETEGLWQQVQQAYLPDTQLLLVPDSGVDPWLAERVPTLSGMRPIEGHAAVYVCENFVCHAPSRTFSPYGSSDSVGVAAGL